MTADASRSSIQFSIVVPTLREVKLLRGMLSQFTPELKAKHQIEVIVSDGGSADGTLDIADAMADRVVRNKEGSQQTISIGRNHGSRVANGEILVFLNADTRLDDPAVFFSRIASEFSDPRIVALTCSVRVFPDEQIPSDRRFHGFFNWLFYMMNQVGMAMGRGECHVVRAGAFRTINGYSEGIAAGEDYDLFRRLSELGKIVFLKDLVVFESPRRYRAIGYWHVMASWFVNWIWVSVLRRSVSQEWRAIR